MTFNDHVETFAGLPVVGFDAEGAPAVADPAAVAWRLAVDYEDAVVARVRHHYLSPDLCARVVAELPGVAVDVAEPQSEQDGTRYVAVGE